MEIEQYLRREIGKNLKRKESLKKHTWIRIGGPAEYFYTARNLDDLIRVVKIAQKEKIPYAVIGEGSNIIVSDAGFKGIVIKNEAAKLIFEQNSVFAESGITLYALIRILAESNLGGLEFLAGIPGTLGGAIYGNAGAYGKSIADVIEIITILDANGQIKQMTNNDFNFEYRSSILKNRAKIAKNYNKPVILSAQLKIKPNKKESILRVVENYIKMKNKKIPSQPSAGCVFKNVQVPGENFIPPNLKIFIIDNKISAGLLIDKADGKGSRVGKLEVSPKHANFIVNCGRGKATDFVKLAEKIKEKVRKKFQINLEEEIEYLGDFEIKKRGIFSRVFKKSKDIPSP